MKSVKKYIATSSFFENARKRPGDQPGLFLLAPRPMGLGAGQAHGDPGSPGRMVLGDTFPAFGRHAVLGAWVPLFLSVLLVVVSAPRIDGDGSISSG